MNKITVLWVLSLILATSSAEDKPVYVLEDDYNQQSILVDSEYNVQGGKAKGEDPYEDEPLNEEVSDEELEKDLPKRRAHPGCHDKLPTLSVGDDMIQSYEQWKSLKKKNKVFILSASDSFCEMCCQDEPILASFVNDRANLKYKGKQIPIFRVDASKRHPYLENDGLAFADLPVTVFYIDGEFHVHKEVTPTSNRSYANFVHHLNRLIDPVPVLKKDEAIAAFLDQSKQWDGDFKGPLFKSLKDKSAVPKIDGYDEFKFKTRVICFFYDKSDYRDEIKELKHQARRLSNRPSLRIAMVTDNGLIKRMKKIHSVQLFPEFGYSSCAVQRYDGETTVHDFSSSLDDILFYKWISVNSKKPVEELSNEAIPLQSSIGTSMFLVFVDFKDPEVARRSQRAIEELEKIQPKYKDLFGFFYADNKTWWHRKQPMGITWDTIPSMAFNMLDQTVIPYPEGKEISADVMFTWFDDIIRGRDKSAWKFKQNHRVVVDETIYYEALNHTQIVDRSNFSSYALEEGYDTMVILYTTAEVSDVQKKLVQEFNNVAHLLSTDKLLGKRDTVRIASFDINANGFPPGIDYAQKLPKIFLFPAFNKGQPYKAYNGQIQTLFLLKYLVINADKPIDFSAQGIEYDEDMIAYVMAYRETEANTKGNLLKVFQQRKAEQHIESQKHLAAQEAAKEKRLEDEAYQGLVTDEL